MQSDLLLGDLGDQMYHFIHLTLRLFSRNTTVRKRTWCKTPLEYYTTPRTIKIISQGESPTFGLMTSLPVTSLPVTSLPVTSHHVAMLLSVMSNGTFCTTTIVRKKARGGTSGHAHNILPVITSLPVTWLHVTSFPVRAASGDVTSSNACVMARSPLLSPKYALSYPDTLLWYLKLGDHIHIPWKITEGRQISLPLEVYDKGIARAFNWLKCLGGKMHLKPTAGYQISILIFEKKLWSGISINIP